MSFSVKNSVRPPQPLSPVLSPTILDSIVLPEALDEEKYDIETLLQTIKDSDYEKIAVVLGIL